VNTPPATPQKKGLSGLAIALIIIGVVAVLGLGTCVAGVFYVKAKAEKLADSIDGGGLVLVSPPEVKAELAGAKKEYVGSWKGGKNSTLDIDADGNLKLVRDEGGAKETITAPIAAFSGNDIQMKAFVTLTIPVTSPPRRVGDHWSMTAKGIAFERK
jgi:hypothetical protein